MNIAGNYPITQQYFCILGGFELDRNGTNHDVYSSIEMARDAIGIKGISMEDDGRIIANIN